MASRYLECAVILTGVLLYRIFWGDSLTPGAMGIVIGMIIVSIILFMTKQYAKH